MKRNNLSAAAVIAILFAVMTGKASGDPGSLTVDLRHPGPNISPTFYGLMTEEINHSYDGGLYGELIQNRIFRDNAESPVFWALVKSGGADGSMALDRSDPVNTTALTTSLKVTVDAGGNGQQLSVANDGFWGIPVLPNTEYRASFYAKADGLSGPLTVAISSKDGATVYASGTVPSIEGQWKRYELTLKTAQAGPTADGRFTITANGKGTLWLNLVSLFPPTFNDRPNGNRIDLMKLMGDLHPTFLRFPGGNYLEGNTVPERFEWKTTLGDLSQRPGHQGPWGYRSSDGLGLLEFLEWCEDLHMQPLLAVYAGYSLAHVHVSTGADLQPYVEDALDEIEYCTGDASTKWGAVRAKDGHPAPFDVRYVEIGNEDEFDNVHGNYDGRFTQFYDAIKAKYPALQLIATASVHSRRPDVIDDHYYRSPRAMERDVHHYDKSDRNGPKIFVGEWATQEGKPTPRFSAALADAAWMTGLERNSDLVVMNCYAPLLVNMNPGASQWPTNLIGYNAITSFGSASYYAQKMFAQNVGDTVLPVEVNEQKREKPPVEEPPMGGIGVGTWNTQAQFKDMQVTSGDSTLLQSDFSKGTAGWRSRNGRWSVEDGALTQTSDATGCRMTAGNPNWTNYVYSVKARKTGGSEGFLILFHVRGRNDLIWWNLGGWGDTRSSLEKISDGNTSALGESAPVTIEANRWYDIRIELSGQDIKCYLDGKLITEAQDVEPPLNAIYATASRDNSSGDVILKVVNVSSSPQDLSVKLDGAGSVKADGTLTELTGLPTDQNTLDEPTKVVPQDRGLHDAAETFEHTFPAYSVSVMRLGVGQ